MSEYSWPSENGYEASEATLTWAEIIQALPIGTLITGEVSGRQPFGVFVDLDGHSVTALARIDRMPPCMELPAVGARVAGEVVWHADHNEQVGITLDEWGRHVDLFPPFRERVGEIVTGRVVKIASIGLFVRLADCVGGLVPLDESAGALAETAREGQEIRVRIIKVDAEPSRKILLAVHPAS
ncbi:S1 RNA-binding domain-containing protein [Streptomyces flavofungini]|uniref:S1 RNA-binding domain-containing protein n=1 Tax=Streptomyces flavofungini TaxID=68200 RepID=UPI0025AF5AED|nr:S1 RNA-binding domain-containing protein [Streptomyces flavofungini]WJV47528.1 S1 RNA-binding domain-containing protein [Streptomyces flavofungini]